MARRKSNFHEMFQRPQDKAQQEAESRSVEAHIVRAAQRRAALVRLRAERDQAKAGEVAAGPGAAGPGAAGPGAATGAPEAGAARAETSPVDAQPAVEAQDQSEALQGHLRRLADLLRDRERVSAAAARAVAAAYDQGGEDAFTDAVQRALSASRYPLSVPARTTVLAYRAEARELVLDRVLPRNGVIPPEAAYRVTDGAVQMVWRDPAEVRQQYSELLARVALRTAAETFALTPPALVDRVVLTGRADSPGSGPRESTDRQAGQPHLMSVQFSRSAFAALDLDDPALDVERSLRRYDRLDLLDLQPTEFEALVRQLFVARGLGAWQTQAAHDDELEAVAVPDNPAYGDLAVIQAKRYSRAVPVDAVRALAWTMQERMAAVGILVTTSWVAAECREMARRTGRIHIIEGRELKQMLAETLHLDVLISLPVLPPGWQRAQIA